MPHKSCWEEWCCPGRCGVFTPLTIGTIVAFAIFSFIFSLWAWQGSQFQVQQHVITQNGMLQSNRYAFVLASALPLDMTLPNNLIEFVGGLYSVDCATNAGHSVRITTGVLPTTWDGGNATTATCIAGQPNAGFLFRVLSRSQIRVVDPHSVVFS